MMMIPVVHIGVDVDRPAVLVDAPAVGLVNGHLLLVSVADGQAGDVFPARDDDDDDDDDDDYDDDYDTCKNTGRSCPRRHGEGSW